MENVSNLRLPPNRDDFYFKVPFARSILRNHGDSWARICYLESLFHWNKFEERESHGSKPEKVGASEFEESFSELVASVLRNGFQLNRITQKELVSGIGSHRVAALIAISQLKMGQLSDLKKICLGSDSKSFGDFHIMGVSPRVTSEAVLEKMNLLRDTFVPVLVLWPRAQEYKTQVQAIIGEEFNDIRLLSIDAEVSRNALRSLVSVLYSPTEVWARNLRGVNSKFQEVKSHRTMQQKISVTVLPPLPEPKLRQIKEKLRAVWGNSFQGVHTTDNWQDSLRVFGTISSPEALHHLEYTPTKTHIKSMTSGYPEILRFIEQNGEGPNSIEFRDYSFGSALGSSQLDAVVDAERYSTEKLEDSLPSLRVRFSPVPRAKVKSLRNSTPKYLIHHMYGLRFSVGHNCPHHKQAKAGLYSSRRSRSSHNFANIRPKNSLNFYALVDGQEKSRREFAKVRLGPYRLSYFHGMGGVSYRSKNAWPIVSGSKNLSSKLLSFFSFLSRGATKVGLVSRMPLVFLKGVKSRRRFSRRR